LNCLFLTSILQGFSWALVAHAYNPSYSGGRDQEDQGSEPAKANRPYLEKNQYKK
jgi:hypothetical protein